MSKDIVRRRERRATGTKAQWPFCVALVATLRLFRAPWDLPVDFLKILSYSRRKVQFLLLACWLGLLLCVLSYGRQHEEDSSPPPLVQEPGPDTLLVVPNVGLGCARFGMNKDEVIDCVGHPDSVQDGSVTYLNYFSRGFTLHVGSFRGLMLINCVTRLSSGGQGHDFPGSTKEGIGMGASRAAIADAFGQPTQQRAEGRQSTLTYETILTDFVLVDDKLVQLTMKAPRKAQRKK